MATDTEMTVEDAKEPEICEPEDYLPSPTWQKDQQADDLQNSPEIFLKPLIGHESTQCFRLQPAPVIKKPKGSKVVGCCQPQSLIYARCRSGIMTCRLGDTSPVQWFSCARKNGNITSVPRTGAVMVLDANVRRKMTTGHPVFVEEVTRNQNGTFLLRISHTNYDRKCNLDQNARVLFDPAKMTAEFQTGHWCGWGHDLKVLGFIVR